jgi:rod shape-determining protein MreD
MYSLSDRVLLLFPGLLALVLAVLTAVPIHVSGVTLTPNVAWLMTLVMAALYPPAWGYGFAFLIGLFQDVLHGTPLGAQALLSLGLLILLRLRPQRVANPLFRVLWAEATLLLVVWHGLLWLILAWAGDVAPPIVPLLITGVVNGLWFPLFYVIGSGLVLVLPAR